MGDFHIKFKHCGIFGHDWIVQKESIIYKKEEIPLSDITKLCSPTKSMGQIIFQFRTKKKLYTLDCWVKQEADFYKALSHIKKHCSDPAHFTKPISEMTQKEKDAYYNFACQRYQNNQISIVQLDAIKAACLGTKPKFDTKTAMAIQNATTKAALDAQNKRSETKTIVTDALIGGVVAGPAGAIVGAIVGKNKAENKKG